MRVTSQVSAFACMVSRRACLDGFISFWVAWYDAACTTYLTLPVSPNQPSILDDDLEMFWTMVGRVSLQATFRLLWCDVSCVTWVN